MRRTLLLLACLAPLLAWSRHQVLSPGFKSLQVTVNDDWQQLPIMLLGSDDVLTVDFDELSHSVHRLTYHLEPCNPDWTTADGLFESDWLEGFNDRPIDDYENSVNTTVLYTHYQMQLPNDDTRLKRSGNYRLHIQDEDAGGDDVIVVELRVVEPLMSVELEGTTNTDIDLNRSHQQLAMRVGYGQLRVTRADEQIQTIVMQNGREDNMKVNVRPNYTTAQGLTWEHNKGLIFEAGNEYHKFEVLDPSHTTMGLAYITWNQEQGRYHAFPTPVEAQRSYVYDVDADGAALLRNSDYTSDQHYTSDYVYVHYRLLPLRQYDAARIVVDGRWATEPQQNYTMAWNPEDECMEAVVLQKLGYYNYQLRLVDLDGTTHLLPEEGSFYQTENRYTALVYYRETGGRAWRLVGCKEIIYNKQ